MFGNNKKYTFEYLLRLIEKGDFSQLNKVEIRKFIINFSKLNHIDFIFQISIFTKIVKTLKKMPFSQGFISTLIFKNILNSIDFSTVIKNFHDNQYKYNLNKTIDELKKSS